MKHRFLNLAAVLALALSVALTAVSTAPHSAGAVPPDDQSRLVQLLPPLARTATGNGAQACGFGSSRKLGIQLVTTAVTGTTPSQTVIVQHSIDGGATWFTLATFTAQTAVGNIFLTYAEVEAASAQVYGDCLRVNFAITGTTPSFTSQIDVFAQ